MSYRNLSALITGASRGLGLALSRQLSREGANVVMVARDRESLDRAVAEVRSAGGQAFGIAADVSRIQTIHPLVAQAAELAGPVDLLVNNASTLGPTPLRLLLDTECEDFSDVIETNLLGPFRLTKAVLGSMILRGQGTVLNLSSDAAVSAYPAWGAYGATKAALDHLTRIWGAELEGTPVRVISVDPGEMNTKMHADAIPDADPRSLADPNEVARKILKRLKDPLASGSRFLAAQSEPETR